MFAGFDLVALGHLHRPQQVDGDRVAYSGTPLPYSFSEEGQAKSVRLVDLAPDGAVTVEVGPARRRAAAPHAHRHPRRTCSTTPPWPTPRAPGSGAVLTDPHLPTQAMARLRHRFPHAVELRHEPAGVDAPARSVGADLATLRTRFARSTSTLRFWAEQQGAEATAGRAATCWRGASPPPWRSER